jgi:poly(A) polymerase
VIPERFVPLLDITRPLAEAFDTAGHELYLVGGVVRDALVVTEHQATDLDYTTNALPAQIKAILQPIASAIWTQGERFGTIGALIDGVKHEITTFRADSYDPSSRKPQVTFGTNVLTDLSRRDFSINAIALRLGDAPQLVDPYDGTADLLVHKRLRTPIDPAVSFGDDPLRMMRAARFVARFGLTPDDALLVAVKEMADRLSIVSSERIRDELDKLLVVADCSPGLWFLVRTGLSDHFLPELSKMEFTQDPIHNHKEVLSHTIAVVNNCEPERILRLAALLHDIAKPKTYKIADHGVTFHHHDVEGARMARSRLQKLKYSTDDTDSIVRLVELHLRFHTFKMGWSDSAVRRYVRDAGSELERLNKLTRADCTTRNAAKAKQLAVRMDELEARIAVLNEAEELASIRPQWDGARVMAHFDIGPSKVVGEALDMLLEIRLDEGLLDDTVIAERLDTWWSMRE